MRTKLLLILALIMGAVTTYLFYNYMKQFDVETVVNETVTEVVVAKQTILKNQRITSEMLELVQLPEKGVHPEAARELDKVVGKYATATLEPNEQVLGHRFLAEGEETIFVSRKVKEGFRAVSVGVNFVQSVSTLIEPDDYVDVIASETIRVNGEQEVKTNLILSKVRVLGVGRKLVESNTTEDYVEYSSVTLELKPDDTVKLVNASEKGNIQLTLHSRVIEGGGGQ